MQIGDLAIEEAERIRAHMEELLEECGIDIDLMYRAKDGLERCDMSDYFTLQQNERAFEKLLKPRAAPYEQRELTALFQRWLDGQLKSLIARCAKFIDELDVSRIAAPARMRQLRDFATFPAYQVDR